MAAGMFCLVPGDDKDPKTKIFGSRRRFKMEEPESDVLFKNEKKFYENAEEYWSQVPPTIDGMLGGFGCVSNTDIRGSELFLKKLLNLKDRPDNKRALDCGAGIGRVTKNLLVKYFTKVDLVEQNPKFVEAGKKFLMLERKVGDFYNSGLQHFIPNNNFYDVIWCQWVLGHLTDEHLVQFLINCKKGLRRNGMIVIKENICNEGIVPDEEDSSVTRSAEGFLEIFEKAELDIVRHCKQANFPKQLFSVKIFALRPKFPTGKIEDSMVKIKNDRVNGSGDVVNRTENIEKKDEECESNCDISRHLNGVIIQEENGKS